MVTGRGVHLSCTTTTMNHYHDNLFPGGAGQEQGPGFLVRGHLAETNWIMAVLGFEIDYNNYTQQPCLNLAALTKSSCKIGIPFSNVLHSPIVAAIQEFHFYHNCGVHHAFVSLQLQLQTDGNGQDAQLH